MEENENTTNLTITAVFPGRNVTITFNPDKEFVSTLYKYCVPLMFIFCLISIFINIRVLLSAHWIRRPLSPTLHISLSLAAADACTSALLCLGLLVNSYLPMFNVYAPCYAQVGIETYRLSGVIITVMHLLALSINHWLGILKPLHYTAMITTRKIIIVTIFLWLVPIAFFKIYFVATSKITEWQEHNCGGDNFAATKEFRYIFSLLFFVPLLMMIFCYTHILFIVRRHQKEWARLSRSGSTRYRGMPKSNNAQQRRTMEGNVKAVFTTLLILGSCLVGWLPAVFTMVLVCDECLISNVNLAAGTQFFLAWLTNTLVILKTLANPIIYLSRMIEIKEGMRRMKLALRRVFCSVNSRERYGSNLQPLCLGYSGSINAGVTAMCNVNGSLTTRRSIRSNYPNTLV